MAPGHAESEPHSCVFGNRRVHQGSENMTMEQAAAHAEQVVLVDEGNRPLRTAEKSTVHHGDTSLHRGFSVFLFDRSGTLLLQQRCLRKTTWPGVWSNSCCGHPQPGETTEHAMQRRIGEELGLTDVAVKVMIPGHRYRFARHGVVENEFCPVGVGVVDETPDPDPDEVQAIRWIAWEDFLEEIEGDSGYTEWCIEEAHLLANDPNCRAFLDGLQEAPR